VRDVERANADIKNMQYEIKRVPKVKEIEFNGKGSNKVILCRKAEETKIHSQ
jgi:hypothetical protein